MAGEVAGDRHPLFHDALGEVFDWLILFGALGLLATAAIRGLTFMPSAGFLLNRPELLVFEQGALVLGAVAVVRRFLGGRALPGAPLWGLAALASVCLASLLRTTDLYATREEVFFLITVATFVLAVLIALIDPVKTHAFIGGLVLLSVGEALAALGQYASGAPTPAYWLSQAFAGVIRTRVYGTLGSPNVLAGFLLLGIAGAAILTMSLPLIWRVLPAAALVVQVAALVLTYSRGGYAGLVAFELAGAVLLWPVRRRAWPVLLLIVLVAGAAALRLPAVGLRAQSIAPAQEDTATSRLFIWKTGLAMWHAHPTWGTGFGTFNAAYSPYRRQGVLATYAMLGIPGSAHDDYLQILAETGLVGAALLGLAGIWSVWRARALYVRGGSDVRVWLATGGAALAGIGTTSVVDENLFVVTNVVMLLALSAAVAAHVSLADRPGVRIWRRLTILPLAALLIWLPPLLPAPVRATQLHDQATRAVKAGDYRRAVNTFREALAADPLNGVVPAYFGDLLADLYLRRVSNSMGPWQTMRNRATELYVLAMHLDPWSAYPHAELGRLRKAEGRYAEAAASLRRAVELDPYAPRYRLWLGEVLLAAGDRQGAAEALREAARLYPVELLVIEHHEGQDARYDTSLGQLTEAQRLLKGLGAGGP